jgi:hypothetical protein
VKLTESTTVTLATMTATGPGLSADTSTDLKLDGGALLGSVRKLSANSDYRVTVPNGVAGIRGTDFQVVVIIQPNGGITIIFTSVTGIVFCQMNPPQGVPQDQSQKTLTSGQSWTVTVSGGNTATLGPVGQADLTLFNTTFKPPPPIVIVNPTPPPAPPVVVPPNTKSDIGGTQTTPATQPMP